MPHHFCTWRCVAGCCLLSAWPVGGGARAADAPAAPAPAPLVDLSGPEYNPPDCPAWAKEELPAWVKPFVGINGVTPATLRPRKPVLGSPTIKIDRYQANNAIYYRPETAAYLYKDYTPLPVKYTPGTLPTFEKIAAQYTADCKTETDKAVALLTKAMPAVFKHPGMPPCGPPTRPDRGLEDEAMLATGCGWCNEQARIFIRLCQVSGIQARMVHLFGQNHTIAEFHADGRWALADASNFFVAAGADGKLLSAAQCHDRGAGQRAYAEAKQRRMQELVKLPDEVLNLGTPEATQKWREQTAKPFADELATRVCGFAVVNYPLPR